MNSPDMATDWVPALSIRFFTAWKLKVFYVLKPPAEVEDTAAFTRPQLQDVKH